MTDQTTRIAYNTNGDPGYIGIARIGADEKAPVWQIKKLEYTGDNVTGIKWADGDSDYDNLWASYSDLVYL